MTNDPSDKPREFWILPQKGSDCQWTNLYPDASWISGTKPLIHVIEHKAYQSAIERVKELESKLMDATTTINKMQNELSPWTRGDSIMGVACKTAFNLGVAFNSKYPNEFNAFLAKAAAKESP